MYTIVGLGNPGTEYEGTRHNVGWFLLEQVITKNSLPGRIKSSVYSAHLSEGVFHGSEVGILFPSTFMNNSGTPVGTYVKEKGSRGALIVVHDDIDLPFGEVRISYDRGAGGHNGVKSIIDAVGGKQFVRIRVGIAERGFFGGIKRPVGDKLAKYVLAPFKSKELKQLPEITDKVDRALELILTKGKEQAMGEINRE